MSHESCGGSSWVVKGKASFERFGEHPKFRILAVGDIWEVQDEANVPVPERNGETHCLNLPSKKKWTIKVVPMRGKTSMALCLTIDFESTGEDAATDLKWVQLVVPTLDDGIDCGRIFKHALRVGKCVVDTHIAFLDLSAAVEEEETAQLTAGLKSLLSPQGK